MGVISDGVGDEKIREKIKAGKVAVAGLGGIGSHIAVMLARIGVGKLFLVDFDTVEYSNLHRQNYDITHVGMLKTDAIKSQLEKINPSVETETMTVKITEDNAVEVFKDYSIVCEAFDNPQAKAMLINALLEQGGKKIIAASGMAGYGSANDIVTRRRFDNLYVCGDFETSVGHGVPLAASRVQICAGHQANMVLRLLLNIEKGGLKD